MSEAEKEFEEKLAARNKPKSKLEDDPFVDKEMIFSFLISATLHIVIFYLVWNVILINFGDSYQKVAAKLKKQPYPDMVFRLVPGTKRKGEKSLEELKKLYFIKNTKTKPDLSSNS